MIEDNGFVPFWRIEREKESVKHTAMLQRGWCILAFHVCFHLNGNRVHNVIVFARKPGLTAAAPTRYCLHCSPLTNNPPAFQLYRNLSLHLLCSQFDILPHCNSKRSKTKTRSSHILSLLYFNAIRQSFTWLMQKLRNISSICEMFASINLKMCFYLKISFQIEKTL